jgi:hypothetical protein
MAAEIEAQTLATMNAHIKALGGNNVEDIMEFYSPETVLFTHEGLFRTPAEIGGYYQRFIKTRPPGIMKTFKILRQDISGEVIYIVWKAEPYVHWATDTFVVRSGRIVLQTYGAYMPIGNALAGVAKVLGLDKSE